MKIITANGKRILQISSTELQKQAGRGYLVQCRKCRFVGDANIAGPCPKCKEYSLITFHAPSAKEVYEREEEQKAKRLQDELDKKHQLLTDKLERYGEAPKQLLPALQDILQQNPEATAKGVSIAADSKNITINLSPGASIDEEDSIMISQAEGDLYLTTTLRNPPDWTLMSEDKVLKKVNAIIASLAPKKRTPKPADVPVNLLPQQEAAPAAGINS
jgi:hypothetical protein